MIQISDLLKLKSIKLLEHYKGLNPYILKLQEEYKDNPKLVLTDSQSQYLQENAAKEPIPINRALRITNFLAESLQASEELTFTPERVLVEYILAETEKAYHILGKIKRNQHSKMYWLPKTQVVDDPYFTPIEIDIDFTPFEESFNKIGYKMYDHQKSGVKFLAGRSGAILADDMGLSKTAQSIMAALAIGAERVLVICPASLKINWKREIQIFCDDVAIISGYDVYPHKFNIINFDILKDYHTLGDGSAELAENPYFLIKRQLVGLNPDLIIVDEAHYIKDKDSKRGAIVGELAEKTNRVWLLTGTPIANRPMDFFNLLKIIKSPIAENWQYFVKRYCDGKLINSKHKTKKGTSRKIWLTDGASNLDELHNKTKNLILRRMKHEVLDLPEKIITPVYHELSPQQIDEYKLVWEEYLEKRKAEKKKGNPDRELVEIILLRKFMAMAAIPHTIAMAENALALGEKVIIFTTFTDELETLAEHFGSKCVVHNGEMTQKEKQYSVDSFQTKPNIKVFVGNVRSAGVGITLTKSTCTIFNSFDWVPGNNEQAEDRNYRMGQINRVNCYYQLFEDTIVTRMWETLKRKRSVIDKILNNKTTEKQIINGLIDYILED